MTFRLLGLNKMLGPRCERNLNPWQPPPGFPEPLSETKQANKKGPAARLILRCSYLAGSDNVCGQAKQRLDTQIGY